MRSPHQVPQHRLGLISCVMRQQQAPASVLPSAFSEKFMPRPPRHRLQRSSDLLHHRPHIDLTHLHLEAHFSRHPLNKPRIPRGLRPPQPVVQMAHHHIPETFLVQQMQQRHRIHPPRNSNQPPLPPRSSRKPRNLPFDVQCSAFNVRCSILKNHPLPRNRMRKPKLPRFQFHRRIAHLQRLLVSHLPT